MNPTGKSIHGAALGHGCGLGPPRPPANRWAQLRAARDGTAIASKKLSNWEQGTGWKIVKIERPGRRSLSERQDSQVIKV